MDRALFASPRSSARLSAAREFLARQPRGAPVLVLSAHPDAGVGLLRSMAGALLPGQRGATFGWERRTVGQLATEIGGPRLASAGRTVAGPLVLEALAARVVADAFARGRLGRFERVHDRPGLVRALARTGLELRLAGFTPAQVDAHDPVLGELLRALDAARVEAGLADRADLLAAASAGLTARASSRGALVLLDLPLVQHAERALVGALIDQSPSIFATTPTGAPELGVLSRLLGVAPAPSSEPEASCLAALQANLFAADEATRDRGARPSDGTVEIRSAPGEARECTEVARTLLRAAEQGIPFERMAVLLRAPATYRPHLEEALRRAGIPASFARGAVRPDPAGRAFLALLACADENLSARRFAEYLSLGQVPRRVSPRDEAATGRWVPGDDELLPAAIARQHVDAPEVEDGHLPAPRKWEALLVEAAVLGGHERWRRRLAGLDQGLVAKLAALEDDDRQGSRGQALENERAHLAALTAFALPCIERLAALPDLATWAAWIEQLGALARQALESPERVESILAELAPMGPIGPIHLSEVRLVLSQRLSELTVAPSLHTAGAVTVAPVDHARGTSFDLVVVPGLAERIFPQKLVEDPILLDAVRERLAREGQRLPVNADRADQERLALRLVVGAAERKVLLSYPRVDTEQGRARVPSFYALEVVRAAEGLLLDFDSLARRAEGVDAVTGASKGARTRLGWPAPDDPLDAIDEAEHDLAVLARLLSMPLAEAKGAARFLLDSNPHLARSLRARARAGLRRWTAADGLVPGESKGESAAVLHERLASQRPSARAFSATALQNYAACPYRFFLSALLRLEPRRDPEPIEELDPLERGSLVHAIHYRTLVELRRLALLPLLPERFEEARAVLDAQVAALATEWAERLAPAIERVWEDAVLGIRADAREWLHRLADPVATGGFDPVRFELSFGLPDREESDEASRPEPVHLAIGGGLLFRGSIDLVERAADGRLRATDYKTGKTRVPVDAVIHGGHALQPVLYALALEQLGGGAPVQGGRLWYCTAAGEFAEVLIPLDAYARDSAGKVVATIDAAIAEGFLPRAPERGGCEFCDYRAVCGPGAEARARKKPTAELVPLAALRILP